MEHYKDGESDANEGCNYNKKLQRNKNKPCQLSSRLFWEISKYKLVGHRYPAYGFTDSTGRSPSYEAISLLDRSLLPAWTSNFIGC